MTETLFISMVIISVQTRFSITVRLFNKVQGFEHDSISQGAKVGYLTSFFIGCVIILNLKVEHMF
jgi:hypothetical protein